MLGLASDIYSVSFLNDLIVRIDLLAAYVEVMVTILPSLARRAILLIACLLPGEAAVSIIVGNALVFGGRALLRCKHAFDAEDVLGGRGCDSAEGKIMAQPASRARRLNIA